MTQDADVHVLYHHDCNDGFGAAFAAWSHIGDHGPLGRVQYLPVKHGAPPPALNPDSQLYILDFSYPKPTMLELIHRHNGAVTLIDHHPSELHLDLELLPHCQINLDRSAAPLAWGHFMSLALEDGWQFHHQPPLIDYIEDRDLWKWELPQSREVSAALYSYPHDFTVWQELINDPNGIQHLKTEGETLLRAQRQEVQRLADTAFLHPVPGHPEPVPHVNTQTFPSEVGHELLERHPDAPFAAAYHHTLNADGNPATKYSLRSRKDGFNVNELAQRNGGGGHPSAAGFIRPGHH